MADNENINYVPPDSFHEAVTFTSQPTPPYYYIDSWINNGFVYGCCHERSEGESFNADDWVSLGAYVPITPETTTVITRYEEYITDFSEESIARYQESGAVPYAVYDDGTEVQVTWDQVSDPAVETEEFISDAEQLALANNQHFWSRDTATDGAGTGAFVTDEQQEAFLEAAAANFPNLGEAGKTDTWTGDGSTTAFNLSEEAANTNYQVRVGNTGITTGITKTTTGFTLTTAPANDVTVYAYYTTTKKPWHNILMNVYGIAMRMGTKNLLALTKSAMAFYDGTGNEADNVTARFGSDSAQIGKTSENHTIIDSRGVSSYDGQGNLAPMRAAYFNELRADQLTAATAYIESLTADNITAANLIANVAKVMDLTAEQLSAATAYIGTLTTDQLTASNLVANVAKVANLTAEQLSAATAYIASLNANSITANQIAADHATVSSLNANYAHISNGVIDNAKIGHADVNGLSANYAHISNGVIDNAKIGHADVNGLSANYATISNLNAATGRIDTLEANDVTINSRLTAAEADIGTLNASKASITLLESDYITADQIDAGYMHADMSNSDVAWIQNGTIKNGAISDAMINSVSANKLTAGTIDASNITVTNLNANNITTGTINGQRIGTGSLSLDKLSDDVYTESEVDGLLATMQSEIDGAIETWTGTAVPTLNNAPASAWSTNADKDKHVGDVYFVVNSQSQQNGYNYRFTKSGNTYSWQLIKDTDITNALSRLSTAEGKITTFDSDITTLKTDTGTLKTKTQSIETSLGDKVDVTTFNDLEDTVDGHSQTISQHTTAISNKADSSTVTSVTNRVSKNEQDISGINTTISELSTTVESKADGSTVETVSNRLNTVSNTVDGHTQSITSINSTLATKADSSTVSSLTTKVNTVSDTVDGHTQTIGSVQTTQTQMQGKLDKTIVETTQLWYSKSSTDAPGKPTSQVTSTSTAGNAWRTVVPAYNASYPNYFYCYQWKYTDGTYGWSSVTRDIAMGESQERARTAITNAAAADTKADNAASAAATAQSTANTAASDASTAKTDAASAVSTANSAATDASTALSTANTANTNASAAVSTANTANTNASNAVSTANTAAADASTAKTNASTAVSTANTAKATADKNVKSTLQLWYTKANDTAPSKPTSKVTSNSVSGNAWRVVVPTYSASYPYYFYCYQYELADGTYTWSDVVYDRATTENQSNSRSAVANVSTLTTKTNTISDTVDGHTSQLSSITSTQTSIQGSAVKSTVQLWFTKANTTAPNKPTAHVTTNNVSTANAWNLAVPTYNASYPNYYYCYEYEYLNGTYGWSSVTRDIATGEAQSTARTAASDASTAKTNASNAVSTANTANTNASNAVSTANTANTNASNAVSAANTAASDASTAKTNAATAVSTANTANTNASNAVTTANTAKSTADKNVRESHQLWFTKANSTAPGKPTAKVTSTATTGNAWTTRVPTYNDSYKYYFYCMQYIAADGTVTWSDVIYDQATTEAQSVARAASADLTEFHQEYATFKQTTQQFESTVGETYATKTEISDAKTYVSNAKANYGYQYMKNIIIYGESSKYYPVYFTNPSGAIGSVPQTVTHEIMIRREYSEQAPSDWNTSTHKGGLNIHFGWNFGAWGGATYKCEVYEFTQMYSTMVGDILVGADGGMFSIVYLRGGGTTGALYHVYSDLPFTRHTYMAQAGVVGENDVPFIGLEQGVKYAQYPAGDNPTYKWNVRAPLTAPNTAHLDSLYTVQRTALIESRVSTAETAINQNKTDITLKANSSDVYTKTQTDGLINTEVTNRNAAITVAANGITTEVAKKTDKTAIISTINQTAETVKIQASKVEIDGTAIFNNSNFQTQLNNQGYATTAQVATAKSEAISTAASDATTKANNAKTAAISTAASDATSKANAAQTAAISTANSATDTKLQNYTNTTNMNSAIATAKSEAISTAASDATSKANAAQSAAVSTVQQQLTNQLGTTEAPYREVEWVESNGRQFIYLDWKPNISNFGFEIDFITKNKFVTTPAPTWDASAQPNQYGSIFGTRNANGVNDALLGTYGTNGCVRIGNTTSQAVAATFKKDQSRQQISLKGTTLRNADGTTKTVTRLNTDTSKIYQNMCVFALAQGARSTTTGGLTEPGSTRIYSLKFYDSNTLAVDLVGAIRKIDGMPGMYDKITKHFYPAPGLTYGNFTGNDLGDIPTLRDTFDTNVVNLVQNNTAPTRMITADAKMLDSLQDGQQINLTMLYTPVASVQSTELADWTGPNNNASEVYLKLTLKDNSTTPWIPVFVTPTSRLTTHYAGGTTLTMTYLENRIHGVSTATNGVLVLRALVCGQYYDSNTYDRRLHSNVILAKTAIVGAHLVASDGAGYYHVAAGASFNPAYTILYAGGAIAATKTSNNVYEAIPSVNFSITGTIEAGAANKMLYLRCTASNGSLVVSAAPYLTTTPTAADSNNNTYIYIPVGIMVNATTGYFSASKDMYAYVNNEFIQVNPSTIIATHKLYYRTATLGTPTAPSSWITTNTTSTDNAYNTWNLSVPPVAQSTAENATKYAYLYSIEQHKRIDGKIVNGTISNDSNTTIIDGGSIITNSITATQIDATNLHVSVANVDGEITIGQSQVKNYVSIRATTINYSANTATLEATLYVGGVAKTTGVTYVWMKDGTAISGATSRNYSVPASSGLNHAYSCKCTATV